MFGFGKKVDPVEEAKKVRTCGGVWDVQSGKAKGAYCCCCWSACLPFRFPFLLAGSRDDEL